MRRFISLPVGIFVVGLAACLPAEESNILVVHEWGTFTELHNAAGISVGGINTDDEPVPDFVHRISDGLLQSTNEPWRSQRLRLRLSKSILWSDRITTRLETPVIYFYPPAGLKEPMKVDVDVQLRGGWLSEFYPNATVNAPGLNGTGLGRYAAGTLQWHDLRIGAPGNIPETKEHVWLAPRGPASAKVVTSGGEAEKYLFYRGVGRFSGPLRIESDYKKDTLRLTSRFHTLDSQQTLSIPAAWLVEVATDGAVAYRNLGSMEVSTDKAQVIGEVDCRFDDEEFSADNLERMRMEMHRALVDDGLFADEATAMLSTWHRAYFCSPGKRVFYLIPREWVDDRMPLTVSVPAHVTRTMMGRIELITDRQRLLLTRIGEQTPSSRKWMSQIGDTEVSKRFFAGENSLARELGVDVPTDYLAYLELGRFRNALLHSAYRETKNPNLLEFARIHGLLTTEMMRGQQLQSQLLLRPPSIP